MAPIWGLLEDKEEQDVHRKRLLNVEEKPFKRVAKRLVSVNQEMAKRSFATVGEVSPTTTQQQQQQDTTSNGGPSQPQTPSADTSMMMTTSDGGGDPSTATANGGAGTNSRTNNNPRAEMLKTVRQFQEDLTLDFAAFEHALARLELLSAANGRERTGYATKRQRILDECRSVRDNNGSLRTRLGEARSALARRRRFDELADRIVSNKLLRPREDQRAALAKLADECRELERESGAYGAVWAERRGQFKRIMDEATVLRKQIRDEKDEVDRREGMGEGEDNDDEEGEANESGPRDDGPTPSGNATPRVDSANSGSQQQQQQQQQQQADGSQTPMRTNGSRTPRRTSSGGDGYGLKPASAMGLLSQAGSRSASRAATPQPMSPAGHDDDDGDDGEIEEGEDVDMGDMYSNRAPHITVDTPAETMDVDRE